MKHQNNYSIRSKNKIKYLFMVNSIVYINSSEINNKEYCIFDNDNILNINTENNQNYVKDKFNIENDQYNIFQNEFENNIFIYNNIKVEDESNNKIEIIHNKNPYSIEEKINNKNIYDINRNTILNIENNSGYNENKHEINENIQIKNIYDIKEGDNIKIKELKKVISLKRKRRTKAEIEESKKNENKNINENKNLIKKPGRKQKKDFIENHYTHTNISNDNMVKKINGLVINNFIKFINNELINDNNNNKSYKYLSENINVNNEINEKLKENKHIKLLYKIDSKFINNSNVDYNKNLINSTMGDILSNDISSKYRRTDDKSYNKNLIYLLNEDSIKYREFFNLKFIDVLNHYIGKSENGKLLKMEKYNKEDEKQDEKYKERIVNIMENYEYFSTKVRYIRTKKK